MAVEERFKVEISDEVLGGKVGGVSKTIDSPQLADVVAKRQGTIGSWFQPENRCVFLPSNTRPVPFFHSF